ncbi:MAG TPA: hypothetical protein VGJ17_02485 [Candidatus Limnocylindrales bacterium]
MPALSHLSNDHDETLIARLAAGDLTEAEAAQARALVASCPACAELETDIRSIIAATSGLPAPRRTRDFRLTDADAARLRRTGWRRLLERFGDPRLAFTRPLATGLVALGIAGLVFASAPAFLQAGAAATAAPAQAPVTGAFGAPGSTIATGSDSTVFGPSGPGAAGGVGGGETAASAPVPPPLPSAAPSLADVGPSALPAVSTQPADTSSSASPPSPIAIRGLASEPAASAPAPVLDQNPVVGKSAGGPTEAASGPSPLLLASVVMLLIGAALFFLRWAARRAT